MSESNLTWRLLEVIVRANETIYATTTLKNTVDAGTDCECSTPQRKRQLHGVIL